MKNNDRPAISRTREIIILSITAALLFAPFSNKAFHIDSPMTLYMTRQLMKNIWNPPIGEYGKMMIIWNKTDIPDNSAFHTTPHPPLLPLYLMHFSSLFGERESELNWAVFPFYLMSIIFMYGLAEIFFRRFRIQLALLFMVSPAIFVNSQNIMVDIPLTAFVMGTFYFQFRSDRPSDAFLAGLMAGLACLTKFTAGTLFITGIFYYLSVKKYRNLILYLVPLTGANGIWALHNLIVWGKIQVFSTGHARYILGDIRYRYERLASYLGGAVIFSPAILFLTLRIKNNLKINIAACVLAGIWSFLLWRVLDYGIYSASIYWVCASAGTLTMISCFNVLFESGSGAKERTLFIHLICQAAGGGFLTLYAVRYMTPFVFVIIIWFGLLLDQHTSFKRKITFIYLTIGLSLIISLALSTSDFQFVDSDRKCAEIIKKQYHGRKVWYAGRLGFMYYMDRAGFSNIDTSLNGPETGDLIISSAYDESDNRFLIANRNRVQLSEEISFPTLPLVTIGGRSGFYGNDRMPYAWVRPAVRTYYIYTLTN